MCVYTSALARVYVCVCEVWTGRGGGGGGEGATERDGRIFVQNSFVLILLERELADVTSRLACY